MKQLNITDAKATLQTLENEIEATTASLFTQVSEDKAWWKENLANIAERAHAAIKNANLADKSYLPAWEGQHSALTEEVSLNTQEAIVMLASLCRIDRIIGALPRSFVDAFELQWKFLALNLA